MKKNKFIKLLLLILLIIFSIIMYYIAFNLNYNKPNIIFCFVFNKEEKCVNDNNLVYNKDSNIYYLPIDKSLSNENIEILNKPKNNNIFINNKLANKNFNMKIDFEKQFELKIINSKNEITKNILFTPIPIIEVKTEFKINEIYHLTQISITDIIKKEAINSFTSDAQIRIRGGASTGFNKKSYRIEFLEKAKKGYKEKIVNMLDINKKDDWILDALYTDKSKIRNLFSYDIWNKIIAKDESSINLDGKFIEFYINGNYNGLYVVKEPITRNKLDVEKSSFEDTGIVIKGINYLPINSNYKNIKTEINGPFEIKYPNINLLYKKSWKTIMPKILKYYNSDLSFDNLKDDFHFNNVIDYIIFTEIVCALDNVSTKNLYFSMKNINSKVMITPWDLDLTFGLTWNENEALLSAKTKAYDKNIISKLNNVKDEKLIKMFKKRYKDIRKNILTEKWINNQLNTYQDLLYYPSLRDSDRWYNYDIKEEIEYIRSFLIRRLKFLDTYMEDL